jgi:uncharacterized caspase-like protein
VKTRLVGLACAIGLMGCAHGSSNTLRARGLVPAATTEAALEEVLQPRRVALVVGVDRYDSPTFPKLKFAASDAAAVADTLKADEAGGFERVVVLDERSETTRARILGELRNLQADLLPSDVFVLYFSGHGTLVRAGDEGRLFLLPSDANPGDLVETAIDLAVLEDYFGDLAAQRKALVVDACFHGEGKSVVDPDVASQLADLLPTVEARGRRGLDAGEALLFASSPGRPAFEDDSLGHGVYTHFLLQALTWAQADADRDEDGLVTAWEAHDYARGRVIQHTTAVQVPEATIRVVGESDLVLAGAADGREARDRALVFHYGGGEDRWAGSSLIIDGRAKGTFPGTIVLPPGNHHIEVRSADGSLAANGYAELRAGGSTDLNGLRMALRQPRALLSVRAGVLGSSAAVLRPYLGAAGIAIEGQASWRKPKGPGRGLYVGVSLGGAPTLTTRGVVAQKLSPRVALWLGGEAGWGVRIRRVDLRGGLQLRSTVVPPSPMAGPLHSLLPSETGLFFVSAGPSLHLGVRLDAGISWVLNGTVQGTVLDALGDGHVQPLALGSVTTGLELGF